VVCQLPILALTAGGLADGFIRGLPRAEDQVDEHHGMEDPAQAT
jgi:hypothetical protein